MTLDASALQSQKVLVTGGAGFIGSHLVDGLLERGADVRVLDNLSNGRRENLSHVKDRITFLEGDIRDFEICRKACDGVSYVFHQAALGSVPRSMEDPATFFAVNVSGTANVFAAARDANARRVVYASSSSVYGDNEDLPKREGNEGRPLSPYALSKRMNEELAETFGRCFGMELVGLRYFNVYGPRQDPAGPYAAVIPRFFAACQAGRPPRIYGDGEQSRDFTFVKDVVEANLLAATARFDAQGAFNIGAGSRTTVNDLARAICHVMGTGLELDHADPRPGDVLHSVADTTRARQSFGFKATTSLDDGIIHTRPASVQSS